MWRWRDSPLTGSIRTAAGTAAGSAPRTATASCRRSDDVSLFCPSATGTPVFTSASSAAYALLNDAASWRGRRNIHPHVPVIRRAMRGKKKRRHGLGREGGGKKSLLARPQARCAISPPPPGPPTNCVSHDGDLYCGCDINTRRLRNRFARAGVLCVRRKERGSCAVTKVAAA